jgi:hypothetical protein
MSDQYFKCTRCKSKRSTSLFEVVDDIRLKTCNLCRTKKKQSKGTQQTINNNNNNTCNCDEKIKELEKRIEQLEKLLPTTPAPPPAPAPRPPAPPAPAPPFEQEINKCQYIKIINNYDVNDIVHEIDDIDFDKIKRPSFEKIKSTIKQQLKKLNAQYEQEHLIEASNIIFDKYKDKFNNILEQERKEQHEKDEKEKKEKQERKEMIETIDRLYERCITKKEMTNKKEIAKYIHNKKGFSYDEINHRLEQKQKLTNKNKKPKPEPEAEKAEPEPEAEKAEPEPEPEAEEAEEAELTYEDYEDIWTEIKEQYFMLKKKIGVSEATYKIANTTYINIDDIRECLQIFDKSIDSDDEEDDDINDEKKYAKWRMISSKYYELLGEHNDNEEEATHETAIFHNMEIDEVNGLIYTYA